MITYLSAVLVLCYARVLTARPSHTGTLLSTVMSFEMISWQYEAISARGARKTPCRRLHFTAVAAVRCLYSLGEMYQHCRMLSRMPCRWLSSMRIFRHFRAIEYSNAIFNMIAEIPSLVRAVET